mmetsp:Transcript_4275/g.9549  ORF Transcript_4275/g.9549 Transcript_4275/m.9549 type:complete len:117 (+) Transcript_4275:337-687(+)
MQMEQMTMATMPKIMNLRKTRTLNESKRIGVKTATTKSASQTSEHIQTVIHNLISLHYEGLLLVPNLATIQTTTSLHNRLSILHSPNLTLHHVIVSTCNISTEFNVCTFAGRAFEC